MRALAVAAALLAPHLATAQPAHVGDAFEILRTSNSEWKGDGSTGTTHDRDTLVARVITVSDAGVETEYDLPDDATADDRAREWAFPARVLKSRTAPAQLRNLAELEARRDEWLKAANLPRTACGKWYFTWNAFRVECDPESVLRTVEAFELGYEPLSEDAPWRDDQATGTAHLHRTPDGKAFLAELSVDPDAVRRDRVEADLVVAEISKKPLARETAIKVHKTEDISGTIKVRFDTDAAGNVRRRTKVVTLSIRQGEGVETRTTTEILERRPIKCAAGPNSI
ncbi:hypothetical protein IAG41_10155 [Sphingomonas sp. JC676]|uniref:hypothetical protein n=1 Tax=Sphingomonas sp. JC676 TaxID=2768065 RepID=UPI0016583406|nr:hypothetical protein [Sphingomonas sp. JC676]MBC9032753.1 hypothetical protein [Sphingomonas sp. JC676]